MRKPIIITAKEIKLVLQNFFSLSSLQGISYLLPLVILPYLIRAIGPDKFGLIAFAQAFVQYFMILTDYGFSLSATRKIALCQLNKKKTCAIFSSVMTVKLLLSGVSFLILLAVIHLIPKFGRDWQVYVLSFPAVIGNSLFPVWFFQGKEKMAYIARINIIAGLIYAASIVVFVRSPADYLFVPLLTSLFFLSAGIAGLYIAFKKFGLEFSLQKYSDIQKELKAGWSIFISTVAINAYTATRVFAVGLLTNNMLTGFYAVAERVAAFIRAFPQDSFSQAIYPRLNSIFAKNKKRATRLMYRIQDAATLGYVISLPLIFFAAPFIVRLLCAEPYPEVILTLRLLLPAVFFVGANAFRVQFLLVSGRANLYSKVHVTAAVAGLPLIFLCIYFFSYVGAAISTVMIEGGVMIATLRIASRLFDPDVG
jgi:polysaccharide transporter, PST family